MKVEKQRAEAASVLAQQTRLQMLQYQLNPHFLFNSLNSIQALVHEDPDLADQVIVQLSDFLRASLDENSRLLIPISEEIAITRKYLSIEKIRYEERLNYEISIEKGIESLEIPTFITQPLVENAIKHGLGVHKAGIVIEINFRKEGKMLLVEVINTGSLSKDWKMGIGLKNVKERLENCFPGKTSFSLNNEEGMVVARIKIQHKNEKIHLSDH